MTAERPTAGMLAANERRVESNDSHGVVNEGWIVAECDGPDARANAVEIAARWNVVEEIVSGKHPGVSETMRQRICGTLNLYRMANAPKPPSPPYLPRSKEIA